MSLCFRVDDDGSESPVDQRERIFEPFRRLEREQDHGTAGYGLGLAISTRAIALRGGVITVEDSPLGSARFTIVL
ncbi:ATP-binding protein [Duganella aceris]|uniref:histidine kinase n=1 Tax=Duganella aceris TaxID=2703883 RepID=A0ABX0FUZ1_9BURK|nr:ATP-binding protein [Duganella aceris]NGZ88312.1 hypothetical protein [Duganella aceris]